MTAEPQPARETRWVDPRTLITRANVRAVADPDPELVASVKANGVIQPPVVYADGDDLVLVAGHRRTAAAIAAGLERIEVTVGPRLEESARLAAQVSENTNRAGLRAVEVSDAVEQMTLLGVPAGQIARAAGLRKAQVESARAVAAANKAVKEAILEAPDLTLAQAAELTAWENDPDAVADLLAAAEDGDVAFAHTQARLADARDRAEQLARTVQEWTAKGYQVLNPDGRPISLPAGAAYANDLVDEDGTKVGAGYYGVGERLAASPDRAVIVSAYRADSVQEVCLNPKANGLKRAPSPYAAAKPEQTREQRAAVIANNKLWGVATGVRHSHLAAFVRAGKFSPALVDALHRHLLANPGSMDPTGKRDLFYTVLDFTGSGVAKAEDKYGMLKTTLDPDVPAHRVTGQLLAAVADAAERSLAGSTWRGSNPAGTSYLTMLVAHAGYQLSDVEVLAMKATDPTWKAPAASGKAATAKAKGSTRGRPLVEALAGQPTEAGADASSTPKAAAGPKVGTSPAAGPAEGAGATPGTVQRTATPPTTGTATPAAAAKPAARGRARS
jgi:ParB family chromosome partitioning protein